MRIDARELVQTILTPVDVYGDILFQVKVGTDYYRYYALGKEEPLLISIDVNDYRYISHKKLRDIIIKYHNDVVGREQLYIE